ncbi:class I mannose-6-phosphate isomerase [Streptomyces olivaceus]|uniref:class I mannose-6-phosphate isomerase n=1 Tax=Streptomyces olivaceus TaxID=47716 RepID=UPI001CCC9A72|nr:class I mannose-6-phosphate isomerase [Streptomyces olivaceus]MBZ6226744.1 class I mannose-6-phosphate isomerase [Streptomyces olivaceus]
MPASRSYDPLPSYRPVAGEVAAGWSVPAADLPLGPLVLAVDGPAALDWAALADGVADAVRSAGRDVDLLDVRDHYAAAADERVAAAPVPAGDPFFTPLSRAEVADLFDAVPRPGRPGRDGVTVVYGPGAALCAPDVLWYADLPKRYAEAAVAKAELPIGVNLGRPGEPGDLVRLFYTDWPVLDRHRDAIAGRVDRWIDVQDTARPASLDGAALRGTLAHLARGPVRTRPYFNSTPWGGQWAASELGFTPRAGNTALGYELIAPEAGVLVGEKDGPRVELPFQLLCVQHPREMLGEDAHRRFGTSFPIRFDYLDTVGGGNLSLHLHPREQYMREVFGWPYTQHETYYVTAAEDGARVLLGLTEQADVDTMRRQVEDSIAHGTPVPVEDHVQSHPATVGQLFMIPAGTPHASGAGNLVLEVSATPYLYSLRLYDWLRKDARGASRPLPHRHGFANLDTERRGEDVTKDLVQQPRTLRAGEGWREEVVGALPEMFYAVHRLVVAPDTEIPDDTAGRFHILNVAAGEGAVIETDDGRTHTLAFAETLTVPAAVGAYRVRAVGGEEVRIVKALVVEP